MAGLYFHIPFCRRKCPYCDFFSLEGDAEALGAYSGLLRQQLELEARSGDWRGPFTSVFFGGGTPSLLEPAAVGDLLAAAERLFGLAPDAEISLEANPGTVTAASLAGYRAAGVNRLSLGVQSLSAAGLVRLGRIHDRAAARRAVELARRAGFDNLSCDLIFALPGQTPESLERELERFLDLAPEHLSCYGLTVEEGTPFARLEAAGELELPDEDRYAELFALVDERLTTAGLRHYEISNYARPGRECRHNLLYWRRAACLGVGAGAHSFLAAGWGERRAVAPDLDRYRACLEQDVAPAERLEDYDRCGAMAETLYLGLRTAEGVDEALFAARFGCGVTAAFPAALRRAGERLTLRDGRWRLDPAGWLLFDHLIAPFLRDGG